MTPAVVWLTGLSGSGKSTLAHAVADVLRTRGVPVELLDGDTVREAFPETGFTKDERDLHVRRMGYLASRLEAHGVTVLAAFVSPYAEARNWIRARCRRFLEVHVATPLEVCEARDVKGLYARARQGEIRHFTGISDPYEAPPSPELRVGQGDETIARGAERILARLDEARPA